MMNTYRSKSLNDIPELIKQYNEEWKPPSKHGLDNSDIIIPEYYFSKLTNTPLLNYYEIIKDTIRNYRKINKYHIQYIKKIEDNESMLELLLIFIQTHNALIDSLND